MRIFALEKLVKNKLKWGVFIAPKRICPLAAGKGRNALPVDHPVDRPTVIFLTVEPPVDRPVDQGQNHRAVLSGRSTAH